VFWQRLDPIIFKSQVRPLVDSVEPFLLREFSHVEGGDFSDDGRDPARHE
jgi:hypothetical protein